jgi:hypothetical protein
LAQAAERLEPQPRTSIPPDRRLLIENRPVITLAQAAKLFRWYGSRWSNKVFSESLKPAAHHVDWNPD